MRASQQGYPLLCTALAQAGANLEACNKHGSTVLTIAVENVAVASKGKPDRFLVQLQRLQPILSGSSRLRRGLCDRHLHRVRRTSSHLVLFTEGRCEQRHHERRESVHTKWGK